ncbi:hypothetical protein [Bacillus pseudomycoides]|uniref:hypothetical protein n=1 Tax=Bacillus pseudomycoides TaxID=64104 RepID=UPI00211D6B70|nr:hypothetical protein [Bacillus pseudomycoides]
MKYGVYLDGEVMVTHENIIGAYKEAEFFTKESGIPHKVKIVKERYQVKVINDRLVIDLNKLTEDYMESLAYDGMPSKYDTGELACKESIGSVELSEHQVNKIMAEYENGGECDWCGEIRKELRGPHLLDFVPGKKMCRNCWEMDRKNYLGAYGEDIGPFDANKRAASKS